MTTAHAMEARWTAGRHGYDPNLDGAPTKTETDRAAAVAQNSQKVGFVAARAAAEAAFQGGADWFDSLAGEGQQGFSD